MKHGVYNPIITTHILRHRQRWLDKNPVIFHGKAACSVKTSFIATTWQRRPYELKPLLWRHNGRDGVSNLQPHDCLLNRLFRRRSKQTSKLRVTGLCAGNSPRTGEFPAQIASNAENVSIWWRHHASNVISQPTVWSINNSRVHQSKHHFLYMAELGLR